MRYVASTIVALFVTLFSLGVQAAPKKVIQVKDIKVETVVDVRTATLGYLQLKVFKISGAAGTNAELVQTIGVDLVQFNQDIQMSVKNDVIMVQFTTSEGDLAARHYKKNDALLELTTVLSFTPQMKIRFEIAEAPHLVIYPANKDMESQPIDVTEVEIDDTKNIRIIPDRGSGMIAVEYVAVGEETVTARWFTKNRDGEYAAAKFNH